MNHMKRQQILMDGDPERFRNSLQKLFNQGWTLSHPLSEFDSNIHDSYIHSKQLIAVVEKIE